MPSWIDGKIVFGAGDDHLIDFLADWTARVKADKAADEAALVSQLQQSPQPASAADHGRSA